MIIGGGLVSETGTTLGMGSCEVAASGLALMVDSLDLLDECESILLCWTRSLNGTEMGTKSVVTEK